MGTLERELANRPGKSEFESVVLRLHATEDATGSLKQLMANKADNSEFRSLSGRTSALEETHLTKAEVSEVPRMFLMVQEHQAKQESINARAQEHAILMERLSDTCKEINSKMTGLESHMKGTNDSLSNKMDIDRVYTKEDVLILMK